jgi:glycosyltransferase involved in cell wall biosynthesis
MKIGIDLRQLTLGASGGMAQLVTGVCEYMFALHPEHEYLIFCTPFNRSLLNCTAPHVRYFTLPIQTYFEEVDRIAAEERLPVLFRTYPMGDTLCYPLWKQIFLIPDNQHETYPEFFTPEVLSTRRAAFSTALRGAGAIGTISEFARKALAEFPDARCNDFFLMGPALQTVHGLGGAAVELIASEQALIPASDYFLFPANLWKHKNHRRLLEAFRLLRQRTNRDISLVLTGHPAGWAELSKDFPDLPVHHLGFVRPELLRVLFERARALLFFSLYEGFGMPLLEAFDAGTPVLCSNTTSLPEVGGDAVLSCDPTNVEAMAAVMERILSDEGLRRDLVRRGKARLDFYSWEKSAHSLVRACERVAAGEGRVQRSPSQIAEPAHMPLVSIVTPSYNQGRFLQRTIESVLNQSYPNIEYVVIDGGSTDESVDILRSYGDRFKWVSEKDRGQTHAINKGMARVSGEILAYLNSDDVLLPGAIERVVDFFRRHPKCDMVYGDADYIDENDRVTGRYNTAEYSYNRLLEDCMVCQPAAFWTRRIAEKIGPFDESLDFTMDYDYWLRIANASGEIYFIPEKLACSRLYPDTKTMSARSKIYKEIFKTCLKHAGQVHQNYYFGYWHHLIHERANLASRILRRRPGLHARLGWLHHKWNHRHRYTLKHVAAFVASRAVRRLGSLDRKGGAITKMVAPAISMVANIAPVTGYWSDNWLAPMVSIAPRKRAAGQALRIAGIAPTDSVMSVLAGDEKILEFKCAAGRYEAVSFLADQVGDKRITIEFSSPILDDAGRRVAFLLQDTNLFSEADIS